MDDFENIYRTYFKDIYLYIRRLSNNETIAEDITSETFYKAIVNIDKFRQDCDIRVWLCQIAKNTYYSYLKKHKKIQDNYEWDNIVDDDSYIEKKLNQKDDLEMIHQILHTIEEPYKEVFMLRIFADLSFKQIGSIFKKSDNWACVTYHRARKMIRNRLEGMYEK